jgi:hypothetical protein
MTLLNILCLLITPVENCNCKIKCFLSHKYWVAVEYCGRASMFHSYIKLNKVLGV